MNLKVDTQPYLIKGGSFIDNRGELLFVNDFNMADIKRFYIMNHSETDVVRAWHGHKFEKKFFFVLQGSFLINSIKIDNWEKPALTLKPMSFKLDKNDTNMLCIPSGYANGIKAIEPNSSLMILSNFTLEESLNDDYRFDKELWYDWDNIHLQF